MRIIMLLGVTYVGLIDMRQCFGVTCYVHLQGRWWLEDWESKSFRNLDVSV